MSKFFVSFFLEEVTTQFPLDQLIQRSWTGYLDRTILNGVDPYPFPVKSVQGGYIISKMEGCHIFINYDELTEKEYMLKHGDIVRIIQERQTFSFCVLDHSFLNLGMQKYALRDDVITIGSSWRNQIILTYNEKLPSTCAVLFGFPANPSVRCSTEELNVYVNGKKIRETTLSVGDTITIAGTTIVFMGSFLFIPYHVAVKDLYASGNTLVQPTHNRPSTYSISRNPRITKDLYTEEISIDAPPEPKPFKSQPAILRIGPSLTMGVAMLAQIGIAVGNMSEGNVSSIYSRMIMAGSMLIGAFVWPILSRSYERDQAEKEEEKRVFEYRDRYLQEKLIFIQKQQDNNRVIWNLEYCPSIDRLMKMLESNDEDLWGKTATDYDFLRIRLGLGEKDFEANIKIPEEHFSLEQDSLLEELRILKEENQVMDSVAISVSFLENPLIALIGDANEIQNMVWSMVSSLSVLHAPDDVKIVMLADSVQTFQYEWMLKLPHIWSDDHTFRYYATNQEEATNIFVKLKEENEQNETNTHYVIFVLNDSLVQSMDFSQLVQKENPRYTLIYATEYFYRVPKECKTLILLEKESAGIYQKNFNENRLVRFEPDRIYPKNVDMIGKTFSRLQIQTTKSNRPIPDSISFLNMYQVGSIFDLNIIDRWKNSRVSRSMAAPIGVKQGNEVFYLDIHEKYHGCHGLVAGTTGSGKSEFLQEYILSLMLNYSPDQIAFILIDFKGGDMARPFLDTPHLAASISNLSGTMLYRARVSLEAEIKRRQQLFNKVSRQLGVDKLDINSYHKYFESGVLTEPLPHLVIIIDEFAQLKSQEPEFLGYLVDVAQVGRSLGIHLILATQKPSGQVSPQIWSNSRFHVCLKVLDGEDSKEMIRRPVAANIKLPGRAYVQVGYDEVFEQIQTGFSGADYIEYDHYLEPGEDSIEMVDYTASVNRGIRDSVMGRKSGKTELEETVSEIINVGNTLHKKAHPLWQPLLPERIILTGKCPKSVDQKKESIIFMEGLVYAKDNWDRDRKMSVEVGISDIPQIQEQPRYEVNFIKDGHLAIYGVSGTGKTMFVETILYAMALRYSPELFQCFILDFGGRNLSNMANLPHCQAIAYEGDADEVDNIFYRIEDIIENRKNLFQKANCSSYESYIQNNSDKLPAVLFVIDNFSSFRSKYSMWEMDVIDFAANAKTYGVYLIITGNARNAIYYKVSEHIANKIIFSMNDKMHYQEILNKRIPIKPEEIRGRALAKVEIEVSDGKDANQKKIQETFVEVQMALPLYAENETQMYKKMQEIFLKMQEDAGIQPEKTVSPVSADVRVRTHSERTVRNTNSASRKAPLVLPPIPEDGTHFLGGYAAFDNRMQGFNLEEDRRIMIYSKETYSLIPYMENLLFCDQYEIYCFNPPEGDWGMIECMRTEKDITKFVDAYEHVMKNKEDDMSKLLLVITDFSDFYDTISDADEVRLRVLLKGDESNHLVTITAGSFNKLTDYIETGLYIHLAKVPAGIIVGGGIDNSKLTYFNNCFTSIEASARQKVLSENKALLFINEKASVIKLLD